MELCSTLLVLYIDKLILTLRSLMLSKLSSSTSALIGVIGANVWLMQLPEKSIPSLVKYFYSWKKTRSRTSLMDRHAKRHKQDGENDTGSELGSNNSDEEMGIQHVSFLGQH